ncbi:MAG: hypothetical protein DCF20_06565 [Pseudanabaena sp.]|nr:MAG: hypothetical protein DCF20_06565 [Pseudanabaena sp.]
MFNIQARKINSSNLESQFDLSTCIYRNETAFVQIIRISQPNLTFLERSVFPNQCIHFSASVDALLEIYEASLSGLIHADTIPCSLLELADLDMGPNTSSSQELNKSLKDKLVSIAA